MIDQEVRRIAFDSVARTNLDRPFGHGAHRLDQQLDDAVLAVLGVKAHLDVTERR